MLNAAKPTSRIFVVMGVWGKSARRSRWNPGTNLIPSTHAVDCPVGVHGEFHFVPFTSTYLERAKHRQADTAGDVEPRVLRITRMMEENGTMIEVIYTSVRMLEGPRITPNHWPGSIAGNTGCEPARSGCETNRNPRYSVPTKKPGFLNIRSSRP